MILPFRPSGQSGFWPSASRAANQPEPRDLTSLDERLELLLPVRVVLIAAVMVAAAVAQHQVGITPAQAAPLSAAYLVLGGLVELACRQSTRRGMTADRMMLLVDGLYLMLVSAPGGGPRSDLVFLFSVHLVAVTLLASYRTGMRIALWDSLLFLAVAAFDLYQPLGRVIGSSEVAVPPSADTALAIMGFWAVALCTSAFSAVNERQLRITRADEAALAGLAAELETAHRRDAILEILLRRSMTSFGFMRGVLYWRDGGQTEALTCSRVDDDRLAVETVSMRSGPVDQVAETAHQTHSAVLRRRVDPHVNPALFMLLPGARNVVVLAVTSQEMPPATLALEYRGQLWDQRIPRRVIDTLKQGITHATIALLRARILEEREHLASMDGLTGLANRRELDRFLRRECSRARRSGEPLSLVLIDVDHFKTINDEFGHLAGDEVLQALAEVLSAGAREGDLVARYGGEEFAVVAPGCATAGAVRLIEQIAKRLPDHEVLGEVTFSAGVATLPINAGGSRSLIQAADEALYESKEGGRNRTTVSRRVPDAPAEGVGEPGDELSDERPANRVNGIPPAGHNLGTPLIVSRQSRA